MQYLPVAAHPSERKIPKSSSGWQDPLRCVPLSTLTSPPPCPPAPPLSFRHTAPLLPSGRPCTTPIRALPPPSPRGRPCFHITSDAVFCGDNFIYLSSSRLEWGQAHGLLSSPQNPQLVAKYLAHSTCLVNTQLDFLKSLLDSLLRADSIWGPSPL